jgi:hypothetical protein
MPVQIETDDFRARLAFFAGLREVEYIAAVGHEEALVGEIHVGEERETRQTVGYLSRLKFREIES